MYLSFEKSVALHLNRIKMSFIQARMLCTKFGYNSSMVLVKEKSKTTTTMMTITDNGKLICRSRMPN